jgi:hypothetical protein
VRILVTGATGLLGRALCERAIERHHEVVALSRDENRAAQRLGPLVTTVAWPRPEAEPPSAAALAGADAIVHLLGEPVDQRWTPAARERIRDSRVLGTRQLVEGVLALDQDDRPAVLVSQSATGYYGARGDEPLDESANPGNDFLAEVVQAWEAEARRGEDAMRVVRTRTGVVLASDGGALARMLPFFRAGIGGPVAGGHQYVPWIHQADVIDGLLRCAEDAAIDGPVNLTAPSPVTNAQLARSLGAVLHRPAVLPVPGIALRVLYGRMADIVVTGQRAVPARLTAADHRFAYPELEPALQNALE